MEKSFLMLKPGFVNERIYYSVLNEIRKFKDLTVYDAKVVKYSEPSALKHYENKKTTPYYKELTDYLSSGVALGIIVIGTNAVYRVNGLKHKLRDELPKKYNLDTDVMRNVIHASDSVDSAMREIELFTSLTSLSETYVLLNSKEEQITPLFLTKEEALNEVNKHSDAYFIALYNPKIKQVLKKERLEALTWLKHQQESLVNTLSKE